MTTNEARTAATMTVWAAFTAIMIWSPAASNTILTLLLLAGSTVSTLAVWQNRLPEQDSPFVSNQVKAKRRETGTATLMTRLIESMSDDELAELRARLSTPDDGEVVSMETLLNEQQQKQARK